ncbi:hypothetical protein VTN00DRAFT_2466 [Thermoascus crustaceus]
MQLPSLIQSDNYK